MPDPDRVVFRHAFRGAMPEEIMALDNGVFRGWFRTGFSFNVHTSGTAGSAPVCRFFSTAFGPKSSHFYTSHAPECAAVKANPNWQFEGEVFNVQLPSGGACPAGTQALYRIYNNGEGGAPSHRYTVEITERELMVANGWVPEGEGIGVIGCMPL